MLLGRILLLVGLLSSYLVPAMAQPMASPNDPLVPYRRGALWGYATPARRLVIGPQYTYAERFDHGLARVWRGRKCGFIDASGREVVPIRFDRAGYYRQASPRPRAPYQPVVPGNWAGGHGRIVVMLLDSLNQPVEADPDADPVLPPWFDEIWANHVDTNRWGLYDSLGRVLLPPSYAFLTCRSDGLLAATRIATYFSGSLHEGENLNSYRNYPIYEEQLLTPVGKPLMQGHAYTKLGEIVAGQLLAHVSRYPRGHWGGEVLVDTATGLATPQQYGPLRPLGAGYGFAAQVFHQAEPNSVPYPQEESASDEHHMQVSWRRSVVWLTATGQPRTAQQYLELQPTTADQAIAMLGAADSLPNRAGVLSLRTGEWLIAPRYQEVVYSGADTYLVRERGLWGLLTARGRWLVPPRYEGWRDWRDYPQPGSPVLMHTVLVRRAGRWGVLDVRGREVVAPTYWQLVAEPGGYQACRTVPGAPGQPAGLSWGVLTASGRVRLPLVYDRIQRCYTTRGQVLPYWQAWQASRTVLLSRTGRVLLGRPGRNTISSFYRGRALLKKGEYDAHWAGNLGFVVMGPGGKASWQELGPEVMSGGIVWRDTQGRLVWRRERRAGLGRLPGPYGLVQLDTAAGPDPDYSLLTAADTSRLPPLRYDAIDPQPEQEAQTITPYLLVRQGARLGVLSTTGRVVLPVQYADIIWPERPQQVQWVVGENGVFWVCSPGGTYQAVGPGGRLLRDTGSREPPRLPYYYEDGYGLLANDDWDVIGYVDAVGNQFFEEVAKRP
jgi:hypothetical protein